LGWLTSLTLVIATITNLVFLPVLLLGLTKGSRRGSKLNEAVLDGEHDQAHTGAHL
jgi:hypothetical protein